MLQINQVSKIYKTGSLTQQALDHVSLNLRDNEFVAILGQSGSGKTTLLNIIGGLDRSDEGELIINGVSTGRYTDRDWDAYRNHAVGFVFQSYNLIPHQTVLANVELALTIGGVSRQERTQKAKAALEKVGLAEHIYKIPSQLSGGQMQRVAIARALVNDPNVLLADEPTGALDSETSIQVMDLLQEVAKDRLVVMVTHNPELAEQYATRIVTLRDGKIISDSDPFTPKNNAAAPVHAKQGRASMSFLTALQLSFNNLRTKLARTILVAFAGSIGIIGIAMILSLSNGVDRYIQNVEEETLQGYPLQISDTSFDLSSFYMQNDGPDETTAPTHSPAQEKDVRERRTVTSMLSRVTTNDLASLKAYLESGESSIYDYARAIEYDYSLSPQIYALRNGSVRQVNPDNSFAALGFSGTEGMSSFLSSFSSTDTFHQMPADEALYVNQYDVKAGRWPENYNECVVVLTANSRVTDLTLYTLGLKDPKRLDEMIRAFAAGETPATEFEAWYDYEEFLGIPFRLVSAADYYVYDAEYDVWTDRSGDETFMKELVENGEELTIVGVVQPKEDAVSTILYYGIGYPASLTDHVMALARNSEIVKAQLAGEDTNVFTGRAFGAPAEQSEVDMRALFSVDEDALMDAFQTDPAEIDMDFGALDLSGLDLGGTLNLDLPGLDMTALFGNLRINFSAEDAETLFSTLLNGFLAWSGADPATNYANLPDAIRSYLGTDAARARIADGVQSILDENSAVFLSAEQLEEIITNVMSGYPAYLVESGLAEQAASEPYAFIGQYLQSPPVQAQLQSYARAILEQAPPLSVTQEQLDALANNLTEDYAAYAEENALPDPSRLQESFAEYLDTPEARAVLSGAAANAIDSEALEQQMAALLGGYSALLDGQLAALSGQLSAALSQFMAENFSTMAERFMDSFRLDPETLAAAFTMNFSAAELRDLMSSLMSTDQSSYETNLRKLGYADPDVPGTITIYPADFEGKAAIKQILTDYNETQRAAGAEEKVISYTDMVDTLMSSVTDIIDAISYVLIAFVAISLVVSSIMIGVITYISVLERSKEIGILRAIGASKRNISAVFNAETFIIGALAGVFGIAITALLLIPTNHIIHALTEETNISAALPPGAAVWLVVLSIVLTLIGGLIPSGKAARRDPVAALRSE